MTRIRRNSSPRLDRRSFLRGAGVAMALPWLDAMVPSFARGAAAAGKTPRRFVAVTLPLGLHGPNLFPEQPGRGYKPSKYLGLIKDLIGDMTVCSGVSHPRMAGGHSAEACILTAAPFRAAGFKNSISLDQLMASQLGHETRFPSLVLSCGGGASTSYTANGAMIPAQTSPSRMFAKLFIQDSASEQQEQVQRMREGRSIMDVVSDDAKRLQRELGAGDRDKLDRYFTGVREVEKRLAATEAWATKPKPKVNVKPIADVRNRADVIAQERAMMDLMALALQTDSTRFMTLHGVSGGSVPPIDGVSEGYHNLSHHGMDEDKIDQLTLIESELVKAWGDFLRKLKETRDGEGNLLDQTMVLLTSNLGNASSHDNKNMPVLLAGGGFKHGQHLAFDRKNNYPLPHLYVSMLQRMGLETDTFATATGTMTGLEMA